MRIRPRSNRPVARLLAAALAAGLAAGAPRAEDIDIYGASNTDATLPNVLLFLDNTSNWSANSQEWTASGVWGKEVERARATCTNGRTLDEECYAGELAEAKRLINAIFYDGSTGGQRPWNAGFVRTRDDVSLKQGRVEVRTLKLVLNESVCKTDSTVRLKLGLMLFNDAGTARSTSDIGGYVRRAVRKLDNSPQANGTTTCQAMLADLTAMDSAIQSSGLKVSSAAEYSSAMFEAFKYFGGYAGPGATAAGAPTGAMGYGPVRYSRPTAAEDPDAFVDAAKTTYRSPIDLAGCSRNFLVMVGNFYPNQEPTTGPARFEGLGYTPPLLTEDPSRLADEWAQFLVNADATSAENRQSIVTYAINVSNDKPQTSQRNLLRSMALHGGGEYTEVGGSLSSLFDSFNDLLIRLASVDSVFTATALPVSTTTQGTYLNQLFIGMFRPDGSGRPRWMGNLKQFQLGEEENGDVRVVDSRGRRALNSGTGFFNPDALSFWTSRSVYFNNHKMGTPESADDAPDGQIVEKGGVAQRLREANLQGASARRMYTLPASPTRGALLSATPFVSANLPTDRFSDDEIAWIRGENNTTESPAKEYAGATLDANGAIVDLGPTGARPSIHGDILHSRPVAVNYGSRVVVYYGANDGALRAVDGSQTGTDGGQELWSFVAPEHYAMVERQHDNEPPVHLPATDDAGRPTVPVGDARRKSYAFDGPIGLFARYSSTTRALVEGKIYAAMRRGGRALYAFDITNPEAPTFAWKITNLTTGFGELGQTWSLPRPVIFPAAYSADPIIIMGGGYDRAEDGDESLGRGDRIYVINGRTGAKMRDDDLRTDWSVPGDVTVVDLNGDKVWDRGYVADVRGNLYRISMTDNAGVLLPVASWTITKIAQLGGKVFYAPDVVVTRNYVAVLVGTGDREKPLMLSTTDRFFLIKDTLPGQTERTTPLTVSNLTQVARVDPDRTDAVVFRDVVSPLSDAEGCYITLSPRGEKVVNAPFTIAGVTYFGTNRPTPDEHSCTGSRGQARAYQFPLFCGVPRGTVLEGGGMPPSPVGGLVSMTGANGDPMLMPFVIGGGAERSPFEAERPKPPVSPSRRRNFWQINDGNR